MSMELRHGAMMPGMGDIIERLERTGEQFGSLVEQVEADQWAAPTPCGDWDVADLVRHVVMGNRIFIGVLAGAPVSPQAIYDEYRTHGPTLLPGDANDSMADLVTAFRRPDVMQRPVAIPVGTVPGEAAAHIRVVENVVHGWDLASALGRRAPFEEADVEAALAFTERARGIVPSDRRPFADPVPTEADAPVLDRLVGLLGRQPR
jgi:uncharacterized protein (TIGR03086 family)